MSESESQHHVERVLDANGKQVKRYDHNGRPYDVNPEEQNIVHPTTCPAPESIVSEIRKEREEYTRVVVEKAARTAIARATRVFKNSFVEQTNVRLRGDAILYKGYEAYRRQFNYMLCDRIKELTGFSKVTIDEWKWITTDYDDDDEYPVFTVNIEL